MEINFTAEIDVRCSECDSILDHDYDEYGELLKVEPCSKCMQEKDDKIDELKERIKELEDAE